MLQNQSTLSLKDNSKILKVKIINIYKKKKVKFSETFLGVTKLTKSNQLKSGKIEKFLTVSTKKKYFSFSGKAKNSDKNCCILIKNEYNIELTSTRFLGFFLSEIKKLKNQKIKLLINKCV